LQIARCSPLGGRFQIFNFLCRHLSLRISDGFLFCALSFRRYFSATLSSSSRTDEVRLLSCQKIFLRNFLNWEKTFHFALYPMRRKFFGKLFQTGKKLACLTAIIRTEKI